jgi:hypothetical protein
MRGTEVEISVCPSHFFVPLFLSLPFFLVCCHFLFFIVFLPILRLRLHAGVLLLAMIDQLCQPDGSKLGNSNTIYMRKAGLRFALLSFPFSG